MTHPGLIGLIESLSKPIFHWEGQSFIVDKSWFKFCTDNLCHNSRK